MCAGGAVGWVGSRAIPHFGQGPGIGESTSGCMGQVYCADAVVLGAAAMGSRGAGREPSYLPGSASNFVLQPWAQKYQVRPACSTAAAVFSGFTFMPHTGSVSATSASATCVTSHPSHNS